MDTTTAATATHLIERMDDGSVNLCESQGGAWITIQRDIDEDTAEGFGFNLDSPAVSIVFS